MKRKSTLKNLLKIIIPTGFLIAFAWLIIQLTFYQQGWGQPGMTSLTLFFVLILSTSLFLFFSFKISRDRLNGGNISFVKLLLQGGLTGLFVALFGLGLITFYTSFINPEYYTWMEEMYNLSWMQRGMSAEEIAAQQTTNDYLTSPFGLIYSFFFVVGMTLIFSIIPAVAIAKKEDFSDDKWSPEIA